MTSTEQSKPSVEDRVRYKIVRLVLRARALRLATVGFTVQTVRLPCHGADGYLDKRLVLQKYREGKLLELLKNPLSAVKRRVSTKLETDFFEEIPEKGVFLVIKFRYPRRLHL